MTAMTPIVPTNSTTRPLAPYTPALSAMMPTRLKRKLPTKVPSAFCALLSWINSSATRGVVALDAVA